MGAFQLVLLTLLDLNLEPYGNLLHNSYSFQYIHVRRGLQVIVGGIVMLFTQRYLFMRFHAHWS